MLLKVNRSTIVKKLLFMASRKEEFHKALLKERQGKISFVHFDEMETFEHTKCKPLSIPIAVDGRTRHILAFDVASMPAKGPLAHIARKRYGFRRDDRPQAIKDVLGKVAPLRAPILLILSDKNPKYPSLIKQVLPKAIHHTVKGRRGCVVGQGELKRGGYDPLFNLNHSCAMIRANINRLFRRTWCTTKKPERLKAHLMLYVDFHNRVLVGL